MWKKVTVVRLNPVKSVYMASGVDKHYLFGLTAMEHKLNKVRVVVAIWKFKKGQIVSYRDMGFSDSVPALSHPKASAILKA